MKLMEMARDFVKRPCLKQIDAMISEHQSACEQLKKIAENKFSVNKAVKDDR